MWGALAGVSWSSGEHRPQEAVMGCVQETQPRRGWKLWEAPSPEVVGLAARPLRGVAWPQAGRWPLWGAAESEP